MVVIASVIVLAVSTAVSVVAVRQILLSQLRGEVERSLAKEVGEFRSVLDAEIDDDADEADLREVFDTYFAQNIPSEGEEALAILDGEPYLSERAHDAGLPLATLASDVQRWSSIDGPERGELTPAAGELVFVAEPVTMPDDTMGTLVIANAPEFERGEIDEVSRTMAIVGVLVLAVGSFLSWVAAGRIVAPIRDLTRTSRAISDSDLGRRITVRGADEVARLAETFNDMLDRLERAFTAQRGLADDAGHELRTPITIVRGHLELMGDDPQDRADTLALVMGELERMDRIVNDLLLIANAGRPDFVAPEPVDLATLTEQVASKASAIADREWLLDTMGRGTFLLDHHRITQAMTQLAANAAQHTPGGPIAIGSAVDGDRLRLWVRDSGPGIDQAAQERIFERFTRGEGRRHTKGAGLGLALVRAIAEAHDGAVTLESHPGMGSTFTLVLPARRSPATADDVARSARRGRAAR
jgi:two-component system OmpR family sensor kinase